MFILLCTLPFENLNKNTLWILGLKHQIYGASGISYRHVKTLKLGIVCKFVSGFHYVEVTRSPTAVPVSAPPR